MQTILGQRLRRISVSVTLFGKAYNIRRWFRFFFYYYYFAKHYLWVMLLGRNISYLRSSFDENLNFTSPVHSTVDIILQYYQTRVGAHNMSNRIC